VVAGKTDNGTDFDLYVVRYHSDGRLDTTFHNDGKVSTAFGPGDDAARAVAIQPDGKSS
jgi:hypothetical protein